MFCVIPDERAEGSVDRGSREEITPEIPGCAKLVKRSLPGMMIWKET